VRPVEITIKRLDKQGGITFKNSKPSGKGKRSKKTLLKEFKKRRKKEEESIRPTSIHIENTTFRRKNKTCGTRKGKQFLCADCSRKKLLTGKRLKEKKI